MPPESAIPFASSPGAWLTGSLLFRPIPVDSRGASPSSHSRHFPLRRPQRPAAPFLPAPKVKPAPLFPPFFSPVFTLPRALQLSRLPAPATTGEVSAPYPFHTRYFAESLTFQQ